MSSIPEEVRARMVPITRPMRWVKRYAAEDRQWPRNMPHPSGKRPIVVDMILQEEWIDPAGGILNMATAAREWRDVTIMPEVEGVPDDHFDLVPKTAPRKLSLVPSNDPPEP